MYSDTIGGTMLPLASLTASIGSPWDAIVTVLRVPSAALPIFMAKAECPAKYNWWLNKFGFTRYQDFTEKWT